MLLRAVSTLSLGELRYPHQGSGDRHASLSLKPGFDAEAADVALPKANLWRLTLLACVANMSGLFFGYDASSINDALPIITKEFGLNSVMQGQVVSVLTLGATFGALFCGLPADRFGRRKTIVLSCLLFIVGLVISAYASRNVGILILGRVIVGLVIGVTSGVTPVFIAEMAPKEYRGGLVMAYQLSITAGILLALGVGTALTPSGNWRLMIFLAIVPAVAQLVGLAFVPDSPRFLLSANREAEALAVLTSLRGCPRVARDELDEIAAIEASEAHFTFRQLLSRKYRGPMLAGMGIALFQAFDGINAIMYYSTTIFNIAGQKNAVMATFAVVNFGMSLIVVPIVNSFPRRSLMFVGLVGQIIGLVLAAIPLLMPQVAGGWVMVAGVLFFVVNFAYSSGPLCWVIISEVFPLEGRGKGAGAATAVNWLGNYILALAFPVAIAGGAKNGLPFVSTQRRVGWAYVAFGAECLVSLFFVYFFIPETHRKSLEEIEEDFERVWGCEPRKSTMSATADAEERASYDS